MEASDWVDKKAEIFSRLCIKRDLFDLLINTKVINILNIDFGDFIYTVNPDFNCNCAGKIYFETNINNIGSVCVIYRAKREGTAFYVETVSMDLNLQIIELIDLAKNIKKSLDNQYNLNLDL